MDRTKIYMKTGGRCFYCGCELDPMGFHVEHIVPRVKGGKGGKNVVPACPLCNRAKHSMSIEEFREFIYRTTTRADGGLLAKYFHVEYKPFKFWFEESGNLEMTGVDLECIDFESGE